MPPFMALNAEPLLFSVSDLLRLPKLLPLKTLTGFLRLPPPQDKHGARRCPHSTAQESGVRGRNLGVELVGAFRASSLDLSLPTKG